MSYCVAFIAQLLKPLQQIFQQMQKKVIIIGAGPGGLTSGMMLAHRGYDVTIIEKAATVGGRNAPIQAGDYTFDTGPTFLHQKFTLDEVFGETDGAKPLRRGQGVS